MIDRISTGRSNAKNASDKITMTSDILRRHFQKAWQLKSIIESADETLFFSSFMQDSFLTKICTREDVKQMLR